MLLRPLLCRSLDLSFASCSQEFGAIVRSWEVDRVANKRPFGTPVGRRSEHNTAVHLERNRWLQIPQLPEAASVAASVAVQLVQLALLAAVGRTQGSYGLGIVSLALVAYTIIAVFSTSGLVTYGARLVASRSPHHPPTAEIAVIRTSIGLVLAGLLSLWFGAAIQRNEIIPVVALGMSAAIQGVVPDWYLLGKRRMYEFSALTIGARGLPAVAATLVVVWGLPLWAASWAYLLVSLVAVVVFMGRPGMPTWHRITTGRLIVVYRGAFRIGLGSVLNVVFFSLDSLLVGFLLGATALGYYSAASRPVVGIMTGLGLMTQAIFPRTVALREKSIQEHRDLVGGLRRSALIAATASTIVVFFGAPVILRVIFGPLIAATAAPVMRLYSLALVPLAVATVTLTLKLLPASNDNAYVLSMTTAFVTMALAGLILIPLAGLQGAAVAALIGHTAMSVTALYASVRADGHASSVS